MRTHVETMSRSLWQRWIAVVAIAAAVFMVGSAVVSAQKVGSTDTVRSAGIYTGTCEVMGERVFELRDVVVGPDNRGAMEFVGSPNASIVENSHDTELQTSLSDLTETPHVIVVFEDTEATNVIACGEIGGFMISDDDDLYIGLRQQNDSGFAGVALLDGEHEDDEHDDDDHGEDHDDAEIEVEVYLARDVVGS